MSTTLKFPNDILRFIYWIYFKPFTLEQYIQKIDSTLRFPFSIANLWQRREKYPEVWMPIGATIFFVFTIPIVIAFMVTLLFYLGDIPIDLFSLWRTSVLLGMGLGVFYILIDVSWVGLACVNFTLLPLLNIMIGENNPKLSGFPEILLLICLLLLPSLSVAPIARLSLIFSRISFLIDLVLGVARLPLYVIELLIQQALIFYVEIRPQKIKTLLKFSPVYWDEVIFWPLLNLDLYLIMVGEFDRRLAKSAIAYVAQSFRQQWAARNALIELTAYDVERAKNAQAIADIAEQFAWLPPTMSKDLENVLPSIRGIAAYAQAALESDTLYNKQTQLRNAIAQTKHVREGFALGSSRQIATRFGRALETWEQVLGEELSGLDAREVIPNVYVAGSPLATASKVFKGRHDLFVALERELAGHAEQRPTLLLFGARRSGKTSAIKQMPVRLGPDVIPVEVDLQSAATAEDVRGLLFVIADQIKRNALAYRRVELPTLTRDDLRADPYVVFRGWLNRVEEAVGTRWILLNLDEYERLTEMMDAGRIDQRVFDFLRGIIQHHSRVTVLLSGSHTLGDLPPIWSDYLINVRVLKIENLKEDEARELLCKPIETFPLQYEPAAVDRIVAATGCQPYLLQATCRDLVNFLNEDNRTFATLADADRALESVLTTGVAYFQELWAGRDTDDAQRAAMCAVAAEKDLRGLQDLEGLNGALRKLAHRDILTVIASPEGAKQSPTPDLEIASSQISLLAMTQRYRFRVELVRRWVERSGN